MKMKTLITLILISILLAGCLPGIEMPNDRVHTNTLDCIMTGPYFEEEMRHHFPQMGKKYSKY